MQRNTLTVPPVDDPILRIDDVEKSVGLKKSTIYRLIQKGDFPSPIKLGERSSGFLLSEITRWKESRIAASRNGGKK